MSDKELKHWIADTHEHAGLNEDLKPVATINLTNNLPRSNPDSYHDGGVMAVHIIENGVIVFEEMCDNNYYIKKTKEEAIEALQEAIQWLESKAP